jgi:hypothetical protein
MSPPSPRVAVLADHGSADQTITRTADFVAMTYIRVQSGGYRREGDLRKPITPAAAEIFWKSLSALAAKGLRSGDLNILDGETWKFDAQDGRQKYAAGGVLNPGDSTGYPPPPDSYAELRQLFDKLES